MTEEHFKKMTESIKKKKGIVFLLNGLDKMITGITFLCYPLLLGYLFMAKDPFLLAAVMVPAVSFVIVTLFRKMYNAKRPYEVYDFEPVIQKNTLGKSFPSRHVFSIFIIAMTFFQVEPDSLLEFSRCLLHFSGKKLHDLWPAKPQIEVVIFVSFG